MATRPIRVWNGSEWEDVAIAPFDSGEFLTTSAASATYLPISASADYLRADTASSTYLTQSDAESVYSKILVTSSATISTTYNFSLNDSNKLIEFDSASAVTAIIPVNASVSFPVGTKIDLLQIGAGQVTASAVSGVTLNGYSGGTKLAGQWAAASLVKRAENSWAIIGNITS